AGAGLSPPASLPRRVSAVHHFFRLFASICLIGTLFRSASAARLIEAVQIANRVVKPRPSDRLQGRLLRALFAPREPVWGRPHRGVLAIPSPANRRTIPARRGLLDSPATPPTRFPCTRNSAGRRPWRTA